MYLITKTFKDIKMKCYYVQCDSSKTKEENSQLDDILVSQLPTEWKSFLFIPF